MKQCPYCHKELLYFHKDGEAYCNRCDTALFEKVDDWSEDRIMKCPNPNCGYYGEETKNPSYKTLCPRCGEPLLHH